MYYLCYQSECTFSLSHQEIVSILEKSRVNNASINVTGILLIINNTFVQVLEGEQRCVETLFEKISLDKRHNKIIKLMEGEIVDRSFPLWSMGYKLMGSPDINDINKYLDLSSRIMKNIGDNSLGNELILSFLKTFY